MRDHERYAVVRARVEHTQLVALVIESDRVREIAFRRHRLSEHGQVCRLEGIDAEEDSSVVGGLDGSDVDQKRSLSD